MAPRRALAATAVALALVVAACGSDGEDAEVTEPAPTTTTTAASSPGSAPGVAPEGECSDAQPIVPGIVEGKPTEVDLPDAPLAEGVEVTVLSEGDGSEVTDASYVTVHYLGISCSTGASFDSSWDRGQPITAALGTAAPTATAFSVIPGWTEGLVGQVEGSLVQVDIAPSLGYGPSGSGGVIAPNETLTFVIEILEVSDTAP
jgi:peptidylprolyl isomerase